MRGLSVLDYRGNSKHGEAAQTIRRAVLSLGVVALALIAGGCSISFPVAGLMEDDVTASVPVVAQQASPLSPELTAEDWRRAKSAMSVALDPIGNGASAPWSNPETALSGSFAPAGQPYVKGDDVCRDFFADLVLQTGTRKLQGKACRPSGGEWSVVEAGPAKKRT
ncbi:Outer membrane surface antigen [Chelatococcus asaccharovorans]|nr:Outer membrane surface antigen [Chelatococcus asaccharovorans]CAH1678613.1 Outer membrane surface antigen [Chelatococcus asaccharovorans]